MSHPEPGGSWTAYGRSHRVASVCDGARRWLPACDVTGDARIDGLHHLTAHDLGDDMRPTRGGDRRCHCLAGSK